MKKENKRLKALRNREPVRYYMFSIACDKYPEDFQLYKEGFEKAHGHKIEDSRLEYMIKRRLRTKK